MAEATACAGANGGKVGDGEETDVDERSHMAGSRCCKGKWEGEGEGRGRWVLLPGRRSAPTTVGRRHLRGAQVSSFSWS